MLEIQEQARRGLTKGPRGCFDSKLLRYEVLKPQLRAEIKSSCEKPK